LVGRAEELRVIEESITASEDVAGIAIVGPPGAGKTRLAHEAGVLASAVGWELRWVVGTVASQSVPMGAFAQWTDGLDANPLRLIRQVIDAITATNGDASLMLIVDDAHLLDDLSALVLLQLVIRRIVVVVTTIRSGERCPDAITALWKNLHLQRLDLQPLSRRQSDELLQAVLGGRVGADVCQRMWDVTHGNALYLRQVVTQERAAGRLTNADGDWRWAEAMEITPSLVDLVEAQIGDGVEPVHDVLDLVAVAEPLPRTALADVLTDPELIETAERRGLITVTGADSDSVRVGHPLYGEVRLARAGRHRLRRLRGRVARALSGRADVDPVRLGVLWLDSDLPPDPAVLMRGAEQAIVRLDFDLAQRLAAAAAAAGAGHSALVMQVHLLILGNCGEEAERILDGVCADDVGEPEWANILHLRAVNLLWPLGRPADSEALVKAALAADACPVLADHLAAVRAVQLAMAGRPADAVSAVAHVDLDRLAPLPALVALWGLTIGEGDLGHPARAAAHADHAYRLAAAHPEATYQGVGITEFHVCALALAGCIGEAMAAAEHTRTQCEDAAGIPRSVAMAVRGLAALYAGDLRTAREFLQPACTGFETYGDTTGVFYRFIVVLTEVLARSGDIRSATEAFGKLRASCHPTFAFIEPDAALAEAWLAANRDHLTEAAEAARRGADTARARGQHTRELVCLQTLVQFGDSSVAVAQRLDELAVVVDGPRAPIAAEYARALRTDDADALWATSNAFQTIGDLLAAADAAAQARDSYLRQSRRGSALTAATRVSTLTGRTGGVSPATRSVNAALPLTAREREIATLIAEGLSNKQIADRLELSVRSVEGYVYRTCARLGLSNRRDLAGLITETAAAQRGTATHLSGGGLPAGTPAAASKR
jgi:DNA-binding CsgD family transcriptional regulator